MLSTPGNLKTMLTREEVRELCDQDLSTHLQALAVERAAIRRARLGLWFTALAAIPAAIGVARLGLSLEAAVFALIVVVVPPVYLFSNQSHQARSRRDAVFSNLVEDVGARVLPGASFGPRPGAQSVWAAIDGSGIFSKIAEECDTIRLVSGAARLDSLVFAEVRLFRVTGRVRHRIDRNDPKQPQPREIDVFRGLFIAFDRATAVRSATFVDPKRVGVSIAARDALDPVPLDDPDFERAYRVTGSDPEEGRALLSPAARAGLLRLKELAGRPVHLSIAGPRVSMAIEFGRPLFAPDSRPVDVERVAEIADLFGLAEAAAALPLGATRAAGDRYAASPTRPESGEGPTRVPGRPATSSARLKRAAGGLSIVYVRALSWFALASTGLSAPLLGWFWFLAGRAALTPSGDLTGVFAAMIPLGVATLWWYYWAQVWWDPVSRVDVGTGELTVSRGLLRRTRLAVVAGQKLAIRKGVLYVDELAISPRLPYDELRWLGYELSRVVPSLGCPE